MSIACSRGSGEVSRRRASASTSTISRAWRPPTSSRRSMPACIWLEGAICGIGGGIAMPTTLGSVGNFPTEDLVTMLAEMGIKTGDRSGTHRRCVTRDRHPARHHAAEPSRQRRHAQDGRRTRDQQSKHEIFMTAQPAYRSILGRSRLLDALHGEGRTGAGRRRVPRPRGRGDPIAEAEGAAGCDHGHQPARLGQARRRGPRQRFWHGLGLPRHHRGRRRPARGSTTFCCRNANWPPTSTRWR